jgi:hypothetical protein
MADIDLAVAPADLDALAASLAELGYRPSGTTWKHASFDPEDAVRHAVLGEHRDDPIKIDVHSKIAERLPLGETDLSALVYPLPSAAGLHAYPSPVALMLHILAHAAGNMVHQGLRLIQLLDIVRLAGRLTDRDWLELCAHRSAGAGPWWALPPLALAARYFPQVAPEAVLALLARECPTRLRRRTRRWVLTDVSYSHLTIAPLPGIAWTRSSAEMCRYVLGRVLPDEQQRSQLKLLAQTEPWASEPRWFEQSQLRRVVSWVMSRPARTESMQPVRAALMGTGDDPQGAGAASSPYSASKQCAV